GSTRHCPPCSSGSNCCSQIVRSVVTAGSVFNQSAVLEAGSRVEENPPICSHLIGILLALLLLLRQAFMLQPLPIAFHPLGWHIGTNPLRGPLRQDDEHH